MPASRTRVAWRASEGWAARPTPSATARAPGPLSRAIATPPRPAGVATATIVSSVENTELWELFLEQRRAGAAATSPR